MLSSRRLYDTLLKVHDLFGGELPADKVVFSCLINGAMERGLPQVAEKMLPKYKQAGIEPKDFILIFRTHAALGHVEASIALVHELRERTTPLMLNLVLRTCVQAKKPQLALEVLHEAQAYSKEG